MASRGYSSFGVWASHCGGFSCFGAQALGKWTSVVAQEGFPGGSEGEESACNTGDPGSIPGSGRSPGEGNGKALSILAWKIPWTEEPGGL